LSYIFPRPTTPHLTSPPPPPPPFILFPLLSYSPSSSHSQANPHGLIRLNRVCDILDRLTSTRAKIRSFRLCFVCSLFAPSPLELLPLDCPFVSCGRVTLTNGYILHWYMSLERSPVQQSSFAMWLNLCKHSHSFLGANSRSVTASFRKCCPFFLCPLFNPSRPLLSDFLILLLRVSLVLSIPSHLFNLFLVRSAFFQNLGYSSNVAENCRLWCGAVGVLANQNGLGCMGDDAVGSN
jgi:hypothetical protein